LYTGITVIKIFAYPDLFAGFVFVILAGNNHCENAKQGKQLFHNSVLEAKGKDIFRINKWMYCVHYLPHLTGSRSDAEVNDPHMPEHSGPLKYNRS
jgi:hypothetical protein